MASFTKALVSAAIVAALAVPAAAQYYPAQPTYPQQYPQQYPQTYPQQQYPYGYNQGYGYQGTTGNPVTDVIDSLLGNRYSVSDRQAVRSCANAARAQAAQQYGNFGGYGGGYNNGYGGYNNGYGQGYGQGYGMNLHVTSITNVERRSYGLRVSGTMGTGSGYGGQYGNPHGYPNPGYTQGYARVSLSFRCNVAYNGAVTDIRVHAY